MKCPRCGAPLGVVYAGGYARSGSSYKELFIRREYRVCVKCGRVFKVHLEKFNMPRRRRNPQIRPMTACERAAWIDTEGAIVTKPRYQITISQEEKEPLIDYCEGALKDKISSCIVSRRTEREYDARIWRVEDIAKEITLTRNCIRTRKKIDQIERFIKDLQRPRRRLTSPLRRARRTLGLTEVLPQERNWARRRRIPL